MLRRLLVILTALFLLAGCKLDDIDVTKALDAGTDAFTAATLSSKDLIAMGKETAAQMDKEASLAPSSNAYAKRLNKIIASLRNVDGLSLNYKVYLTSDVNAFALPDGSIRVYSGLMDLMTDDEVYFVIGHEIGHVKNGDSLDKFRMAYAASAARKGAAAVGGAAGRLSAGELGDLGEAVLNAQFSQSQESDADVYGLHLMEKNGKNSKAAVSALNKLASPGGGSGASFLSSHPDSKSRAAKLEKLRKK